LIDNELEQLFKIAQIESSNKLIQQIEWGPSNYDALRELLLSDAIECAVVFCEYGSVNVSSKEVQLLYNFCVLEIVRLDQIEESMGIYNDSMNMFTNLSESVKKHKSTKSLGTMCEIPLYSKVEIELYCLQSELSFCVRILKNLIDRIVH